MLEKVREYIKFHHMLEMGDRVVMGISGGADSVCLLHIMQELREEYGLSLFVVHVHHGIRKEAADKDAEYVKNLCQKYGISFYLFKEDIPKLAKDCGMSEEEGGRQCRYRCFYQVADQVKADKIATAHHMGDQAETVLFHLIRGTNLSGVTGIAPVNGKMIRPLLSCSKKSRSTGLSIKMLCGRKTAPIWIIAIQETDCVMKLYRYWRILMDRQLPILQGLQSTWQNMRNFFKKR